ncbi:MAG: D,D-dipeptide ABC transporter permease, partial [Brucella intermedia]
MIFANFHNWALDDSPTSRSQANWGRRYRIWVNLRANPLAMIGLFIIVAFVALSLAAPLLAPYDPSVQDLGNRLSAPTAEHWFGTDELGRDILSRILYGGRVTLGMVIAVVILV